MWSAGFLLLQLCFPVAAPLGGLSPRQFEDAPQQLPVSPAPALQPPQKESTSFCGDLTEVLRLTLGGLTYMPVPEPATIARTKAFSDIPNMGMRHPFPWSHPHRLKMKKGTFPKRKADAGLRKRGMRLNSKINKESLCRGFPPRK